jgi:hypothetical protein
VVSSTGLARLQSGLRHGEQPQLSEVHIWPAFVIGMTPSQPRTLLLLAQHCPQPPADESVYFSERAFARMLELAKPPLEHRAKIFNDSAQTLASRALGLFSHLALQPL